MNQPSLLLSVVLICFSFGALVGRLVEQRRLLKRGLADWDRFWLLLFAAMSLNLVERAVKAGWLPHGALIASLANAGTYITTVPVIYLVAKTYLAVKRGTA